MEPIRLMVSGGDIGDSGQLEAQRHYQHRHQQYPAVYRGIYHQPDITTAQFAGWNESQCEILFNVIRISLTDADD